MCYDSGTKLISKDEYGTLSECETFADVAKAFGGIWFTLPGRMLSRPKDQVQTQEEDLSQPDQKLPESP